MTHPSLRACPYCGLIQTVPEVPEGRRVCCHRCLITLRRRRGPIRTDTTAAVALAALLVYPLAITLPIMRVEQLGHAHDAGILDGVVALLANGDWLVGIVVLLCSVLLPILKLTGLLLLSLGARSMRHHHRALTYRLVEWTGRWGMLDVLLVAVLVAVVKLGDMVEIQTGPGLLAFTVCVILSLVAAACFDPHSLWERET